MRIDAEYGDLMLGRSADLLHELFKISSWVEPTLISTRIRVGFGAIGEMNRITEPSSMNNGTDSTSGFRLGKFSIDEHRPMKVIVIGAGVSGILSGIRSVASSSSSCPNIIYAANSSIVRTGSLSMSLTSI